MKKLLITLGIIFVAALAAKDTINKFKELGDIAVTPSQLQMRTPAMQNTGQSQFDTQTQRLRNRNSDNNWDSNPNNYVDRIDNFNRNQTRSQNKLRKNTTQNPFEQGN